MHAGIAGQALERAGEIDQLADVVILLVQAPELRLLGERVVERDAELERDELGDPVDPAEALAEHATDVADHGLGRHRAVGDDLRDPLAAVFLRHVLDDRIAPRHAEVDVEVRHRDAFGIEEALEQQVVLERVEVGNAQHVGDQRTGAGAAPRPDRHAVGARPADEIGDDEEVALEAHLADAVELEREARVVLARRDVLEAQPAGTRGARARLGTALKPRRCLDAQEPGGRLAVRHRVGRQERLAEPHFERAAPRDLHRLLDRPGQVGEQLGHFLAALQVLLLAVVARSPAVTEQQSLVYADARLVRLEVAPLEEAHVVGRHHAEREPWQQRPQRVDVVLLAGPPGAADLDVVAIPEQSLPLGQRPFGLGPSPRLERPSDVTLDAAGQGDEPARGARVQPATLQQWLALVTALEVGAGYEPGQVAVAVEVLAQQGQPRRLGALAGLPQPGIDADDRLDAGGQRRAIELHHREQVRVIRQGDGGHAGGGAGHHQLVDAHHAVLQRVLGMQAKVDEGGHRQDFTGSKERRCSGHGPCSAMAARCAGVP